MNISNKETSETMYNKSAKYCCTTTALTLANVYFRHTMFSTC